MTFFYASIKERFRINNPASEKKTYHIVLDLGEAGIEYEVGDCLAIYPKNNPATIAKILSSLKMSGEERIIFKSKESYSLRDFLSHKANIARVNLSLAKTAPHPLSKEAIAQFEVWDFLETFKPSLTPQAFVDTLSPLLPRFYSIASSMKKVGKEAHLTVALTQYDSNQITRFGACSYFLTHLAPLHTLSLALYVQKSKDFSLAKESFDKPLIMIGPGTGIAPFVGFMQERVMAGSLKNWLFFGERHRAYDFYYEEFWNSLVAEKKLNLDLAFSRDQTQKIYVQHKMLEKSALLWQWIEEGAYLFVCGDAGRMAKDVDKTLLQIVSQEGKCSEERAKEYIKNLKHQKRYLRDVY